VEDANISDGDTLMDEVINFNIFGALMLDELVQR
jgi:hypothetical protein